MAYQLKEKQITIFRNKEKKDKQPDYKGTALLNGEEMDISLWVAEAKSGLKYFNGQIKPKQTLKPLTEEEKQERSERNHDLPF